jgi:hypothetical protein
MSNLIGKQLFRSLVMRYQSEIQSNQSTLMIYLTKPVGIGEHPQHLEEMDKLVCNVVDAKDKLEYLLEEETNLNEY